MGALPLRTGKNELSLSHVKDSGERTFNMVYTELSDRVSSSRNEILWGFKLHLILYF